MITSWYPIIEITFIIFLMILSTVGIVHSKSKYRVRRNFSNGDRKIVRYDKQKNKCKKCHKTLTRQGVQSHHKDGNRTNNRKSNCEVLCRKCHAGITSRNHASYRSRTNWSSLKWSLLSVTLLLVMIILFIHS
jgi:hypothetical protein